MLFTLNAIYLKTKCVIIFDSLLSFADFLSPFKLCEIAPMNFVTVIFTKIWKYTVLSGFKQGGEQLYPVTECAINKSRISLCIRAAWLSLIKVD